MLKQILLPALTIAPSISVAQPIKIECIEKGSARARQAPSKYSFSLNTSANGLSVAGKALKVAGSPRLRANFEAHGQLNKAPRRAEYSLGLFEVFPGNPLLKATIRFDANSSTGSGYIGNSNQDVVPSEYTCRYE